MIDTLCICACSVEVTLSVVFVVFINTSCTQASITVHMFCSEDDVYGQKQQQVTAYTMQQQQQRYHRSSKKRPPPKPKRLDLEKEWR